jgi:putative hemolysin
MMFAELAIVAALIVLNGLLAMSELAIVSARPARLKTLIEQGVKGSRRALALTSDPGRFLSTVQIGITLVGILAGAYSGATLGRRLADWLMESGLGVTVAEYLGFGLVVTIITYCSLIVGELVPKQIALRDPERIACKVAPAMTVLARVAAPAVWLLSFSGRAVLSLFGGGGPAPNRVTEEEIRTLVAEAEGAGVLEPQERAMISAVLRLGDRPVRAVMTPRHEVDMIDIGDDAEMIRRRMVASKHTRLPVYDGEVDGVIGVVQAKDFLGKDAAVGLDDIRAMVRPAPIVPDSMDALDVVELFRETAVHIGLVHDEYGNFEGVITAADILESIVGELPAEGQREPGIVERADGSFLVSGSMQADELAERLHLKLPPERNFQTVAGLVLAETGHLPEVCETVDIQGWRFEVVDLDGRRIDKLLVARIAAMRRARA